MPRSTRFISRLRLESLENRTLLSTFTVANTNDAGSGSFRQAIIDANATVGLDTIAFNIGSGVKTITPKTALPAVTDPVLIDGTTQPGSGTTPRIVLSGSKIQSATGLNITGGGSTVRGLNINGFTTGIGIHLQSAGSNIITGNFIGTNASGTSKVANGTGLKIDSLANQIGGTTAAVRNLVSGNTTGIHIGIGSGNIIEGNYVGTNAAGTSALGNSGDGVLVNATSNTVGGNSRPQGNLISGNGNAGVNVIGTGVQNIFVRQNFIGLNAAGNAKIGNRTGVIFGAGVAISAVGGGLANEGNWISGNSHYGVYLNAVANGVRVGNNFIGTDFTGTMALGNGLDGVFIDNASNITLGGPQPTAVNVIAANGGSGVRISGVGSTINRVQGNRIGTNAAGTAKLPNLSGVTIDSGAQNNHVGCPQAPMPCNVNSRNTISGNFLTGVALIGTNTSNNRVQGNFIGTDVTGTVKLANGAGLSLLYGASNNTIGGTTAITRNLISGNAVNGLSLIGTGVTGNQILGNSIGTNATGTLDLGNGGPGVAALLGADSNNIGGAAAGAGNIIAFNGHAGVYVNDTIGIAIRVNRIFSNEELGIELDDGGNNNQPAPVLTSAMASPGSVAFTGTLTAAPNTTYTIDFFSNSMCDPSGFGEGEIYRASTTATTDSAGQGTFAPTFSVPVPAGDYTTATATDPAGNTSEFSACEQVGGTSSITSPGDDEDNNKAPFSTGTQPVRTIARLSEARQSAPEFARPMTTDAEPSRAPVGNSTARMLAHARPADEAWLEALADLK